MTNPLPPLRLGRMHEVYGPSAHGFAAVCALGLVLWVREGWQKVALLPLGMTTILSTDRLILATPATQTDALAVAEEALRDGAVQTVVLEISAPLNLREGRRLQLAAKAGNTLGICILPNAAMGSNAAETRWHCAPVFDGGMDSTLMRWSLIKNKSGTIGAWHVRWNEEAHHLDVVAAPAVGTMGAPSDG